ncbi:MAG: Asp23/Gls24 family envelope stress response protein [Clostridia bacterium]|nr:Asp23/Gls24 family envelope stress response protein [Clostridia bacterium]
MSVSTRNVFGKISISDYAIAKVVSNATLECYGIVETAPRKFIDSLRELFHKKRPYERGIKVTTSGDRVYIDVYVIIKYGVSINAVAESLKEAIKYRVERFTGMIVDTVNVNIVGVKL